MLKIRHLTRPGLEPVDLELAEGQCTALSGPSGAGKSILLDALGLALGMRAEARLIRHGAEKASVTAAFDVGPGHPARAILARLDMDGGMDGEEDTLVLRRVLGRDGRSMAFINDQPVSVQLLKETGEALVEIATAKLHVAVGCPRANIARREVEMTGISPSPASMDPLSSEAA